MFKKTEIKTDGQKKADKQTDKETERQVHVCKLSKKLTGKSTQLAHGGKGRRKKTKFQVNILHQYRFSKISL